MDALAPTSEVPIHAAPERNQPVGLAERFRTIDAVRGMALLGILLMNIPYFGQAPALEHEPFRHPGTLDYYVHLIVQIGFEGKMRGLFSMLFGAGILIFTSRKEAAGLGSADLLQRRLLWMLLFGVIHEYVFLWVGDILFDYAVAGLALYVFRKLPPRKLLLAALVCVTITTAKHYRQHHDIREKRAKYLTAVSLGKAKKKLTDDQKKDKEAWEKIEKQSKPDPKEVAEFNADMRGNYPNVYKTLEPFNILFHSRWLYLLGVWDVWAMMLLGMALFKWGFFTNKLSTRTYGLMLAAGYGIGLPLAAVQTFDAMAQTQNVVHYADTRLLPGILLYDAQRALVGLGHASVLLLLFRAGWLRGLLSALANVGQMAFSNYVLQTTLCSLFFYGFGLGYFGKLAYHQLYYVVAGVWVVNLLFSAVWLRFFRFGPLEWAWRSLTYWERQPWRKD
jgi:uncharacterized protein